MKDNKFYTGITNNLDRRIKEHNQGKKSTLSTKNRGPFQLVYCEQLLDRPAARQREKYFKSAAGRRFLKTQFRDSSMVEQPTVNR